MPGRDDECVSAYAACAHAARRTFCTMADFLRFCSLRFFASSRRSRSAVALSRASFRSSATCPCGRSEYASRISSAVVLHCVPGWPSSAPSPASWRPSPRARGRRWRRRGCRRPSRGGARPCPRHCRRHGACLTAPPHLPQRPLRPPQRPCPQPHQPARGAREPVSSRATLGAQRAQPPAAARILLAPRRTSSSRFRFPPLAWLGSRFGMADLSCDFARLRKSTSVMPPSFAYCLGAYSASSMAVQSRQRRGAKRPPVGGRRKDGKLCGRREKLR